MKPRHHLYFDEVLTAQLEALAAKPGASKSAIVSNALRAYLARRGAKELDDLLKVRLDRFNAQLNRIERDQQILLETLALFIRQHFMATPPLPEGDEGAARAVAEARFQAFITEVGRQIGVPRTGTRDTFAALAPDPGRAVANPERTVA